MSDKKFHIEKNTVQETLVIPLYARKLCTQRFPTLFSDPLAVRLIDRLDYDFSQIEQHSQSFTQQFGSLEAAMRQTDLAIEVAAYLEAHPQAAVVNLGCGLDQTGENADNGACRIYNVDLPDVMAIRNQLLPPGERTVNIAADLNDPAWLAQIDGSRGAVFFAAGVFYYFSIADVRTLINRLAAAFPGGRLVFDTAGKAALKMMLKTFIKQAGIKNVDAFFHVNSLEQDVLPWLEGAQASSRGYMLGYHDLKDACVPKSYRLLSKIGDGLMKMQILRLDFDPAAAAPQGGTNHEETMAPADRCADRADGTAGSRMCPDTVHADSSRP